MNDIVQFILRHGYPILFAAVFARQIGLPVPAPGFLLAAGALSATGKLDLIPALVLAVIACVLADWLWYEGGRVWGDKVLHFIHSFAPDPEGADRKSRKLFTRHGPPLLVLDKFVPGLDAVVPPLAGTSGTSRMLFLVFETIGAILWAIAYTGLGYVFSDDLSRAAAYIGRAGAILAGLVLGVVAILVVRTLVRGHRTRRKSEQTLPDPMRCQGPFARPSTTTSGLKNVD